VTTSEARLLLIETSGGAGLVALAEGATVRTRRLDQTRRHARDLAPAVRELLLELDWAPATVAAVLVGLGPGSYTGLRVGLMSAKAFAFATGCALIGLPTFPPLALQAPAATFVDVIADAQQGLVYVQRFQAQPGGALPREVEPLRIEPAAAWRARLTAEILVTGPGLALHKKGLPGYVATAGEELWQPQADALLRLGRERLARGARDDLWALEPLYLRPSSAEEKKATPPG
jgi:tRNA threonylcarbamoyladenosine biosynthesis protein TsaB